MSIRNAKVMLMTLSNVIPRPVPSGQIGMNGLTVPLSVTLVLRLDSINVIMVVLVTPAAKAGQSKSLNVPTPLANVGRSGLHGLSALLLVHVELRHVIVNAWAK